MGVPPVRVSNAEATASVDCVRTSANWFMASTSSFQEYS